MEGYIADSHSLATPLVHRRRLAACRHRAPIHGDGRAGYGGGGQTIIIPLRYDDHVWIQLNKDSALLNDYTTFSGHLLFDD